MSDDKSFLDQLAEYYNQAGQNRKEEEDSMNDFPKLGEYGPRQRSFTRSMLAANPELPQDDVRDYVQNVKDDNMNNIANGAANIGGLKVLGDVVENVAPRLLPRAKSALKEVAEDAPRYIKDLSEEYLPKGISSKVTDLYHNFKAGDNITKFTKASEDSARLNALQNLANQTPTFVAPELNEAGKAAASKSSMIQALIESAKTDAKNLAESIAKDPKKLKQAEEKTITLTPTSTRTK